MTVARALALVLLAGATGHPSARLTPGTVALLDIASDSAARETVLRAIEDDDPLVRTVAARLVAIHGDAALNDAIARQWAHERDPSAAAEQARALLYFRGADGLDIIEARTDVPGADVSLVVAEWIARVEPRLLPPRLPGVAAVLGEDVRRLVPHIRQALAKRPESAEPLLTTWRSVSTPIAWRALLMRIDLSDDRNAHLLELLSRALEWNDPGIRESTVWSLVANLALDVPVPAALLVAALPPGAKGSLIDEPTWEAFGRELIARRLHDIRTPDRSALIATEAGRHVNDARLLAWIPETRDSERVALRKALGEFYPEGRNPIRTGPARTGTIRAAPFLWPGFLRSLLDAGRCRPGGEPPLALFEMVYLPHGRPVRAQQESNLSQACKRALDAFARLITVDAEYPPIDGREWLVVPLHRTFIECSSLPGSSRIDAPKKVGIADGPVKPPRRTRNVDPGYPSQLYEKRISGAVYLESILTPSGCVGALRVIAGADPALDVNAIFGVSGWRFAPFGERDAPLSMGIVVNYEPPR